jgi:hypothetical protein
MKAKNRLGRICLALAVLGWTTGSGAAEKPERSKVEGRLRQYCDPVCELRTQDVAFSLMLEAYREFHGHQIERDYSKRMAAVEKLQSPKDSFVIEDNSEFMKRLQEFVRLLAAKERELRFAKLQTQVQNIRTTYNCIRQNDEANTGKVVPSQVDTRAAAASLREFVIVSPGSVANGNLDKPQSIPAASVLLDTPPIPLAPGHTVASCTPEDPVLIIDPPDDMFPARR